LLIRPLKQLIILFFLLFFILLVSCEQAADQGDGQSKVKQQSTETQPTVNTPAKQIKKYKLAATNAEKIRITKPQATNSQLKVKPLNLDLSDIDNSEVDSHDLFSESKEGDKTNLYKKILEGSKKDKPYKINADISFSKDTEMKDLDVENIYKKIDGGEIEFQYQFE